MNNEKNPRLLHVRSTNPVTVIIISQSC